MLNRQCPTRADTKQQKETDDESLGCELSDQTIGVSASYAITESLSIGAQVNYTWIPSHTLRKYNYMGLDKDQICWCGVNISFSF